MTAFTMPMPTDELAALQNTARIAMDRVARHDRKMDCSTASIKKSVELWQQADRACDAFDTARKAWSNPAVRPQQKG